MVDRLKTTESISQGAWSIRFVPDIMNGFCMRQTAKLQYRYYRTSEFDSPLCSSFDYTGSKTLARLANYAAPMPNDACQTLYGGPECLLRLEWQIGPNNCTYLPGGQGAGVLHTATRAIDKQLS